MHYAQADSAAQPTLSESIGNCESVSIRIERLLTRLDEGVRGYGEAVQSPVAPPTASLVSRADNVHRQLMYLADKLESICGAVAQEPPAQLAQNFAQRQFVGGGAGASFLGSADPNIIGR